MTTHSWDEDPRGEWTLEIENVAGSSDYGKGTVPSTAGDGGVSVQKRWLNIRPALGVLAGCGWGSVSAGASRL